MKQLFILSLAICLITGCRIYKPYSRPEVNTDGLYRDMTVEDTATVASLSWKELFTDNLLQSLNIAHLRVKEAEAVLMNARLSYLPSLSLNPEGGVSSFDGSAPGKTYNLALSASWEIDVFGKVTNAKRGAKAALEGSRAYEQAVQTQLVATIANSYYTLLMLDRQLVINKETLESWSRTVKTLEALKRAGESNDTAILQAKANHLALEASILSIQKSIRETENSLSVLLAMAPQTIERKTLEEQSF